MGLGEMFSRAWDGDVLCGGGNVKENRRGRIGEVKKVKDSQRRLGLCGCPMGCGGWRVLWPAISRWPRCVAGRLVIFLMRAVPLMDGG